MKLEKCKACDGKGYRSVGMSEQMKKNIDCGFPSTYECEHCHGTGKVEEGKEDYSIPDEPGR